MYIGPLCTWSWLPLCAVSGGWGVWCRAVRAPAFLERPRVDEGDRAGAAVDVDVAVALVVDRAAVRERGVVLEVDVAGGEDDRAGVGDGPSVEEDAVDVDGGAVGDGERAAAADGAAVPVHRRG